MRHLLILSLALCLLVPLAVTAAPNAGVYTSTDIGGQILTGRASTHRTGINSGLPHTLHGQSWNGTLGTQWELRCAVESTPFNVQDNRDGNGTGTVVYTSHFSGGEVEFYAGGWPWGDGVATLGATTLITTVQFVNDVPVASVVNGNTSGEFENGCSLTFAIANGYGVGETTSLDPGITKPADYPVFLADDCSPADPGSQYGTWGAVITITVTIDCPTPVQETTWGAIKALYN